MHADARLGIGIDFGTTNSTAAVFDGRDLRLVDLDPHGPVSSIMPTALYLNRQFLPKVGSRATESYLSDNANRRVRLEKEEVGEFLLSIDTMAGYFEDWVKVHAFTDRDLPSRLFRSVKTWLGSENLNSLKVFERDLNIVALVTPILDHIRRRIENSTATHKPIPMTPHVGRPVIYHGGNANANSVALERMSHACRHAGFASSVPYPEPVAATLSFLHDARVDKGSTYLTFDFGGGTLDLSVVRTLKGRSASETVSISDGFKILGTHGIDIGGDDIDQQIYRQVVFPKLGSNALVASSNVHSPDKVQFRFTEFEDRLLIWQHSHELNRNELRELIIQGMREGGEVRKSLGRLLKLITYNHSYRVFQAIESAKRALSDRKEAVIDVPEIGLKITLNRHHLQKIIVRILGDIEITITAILDKVGLRPEQIDAVVCTGGSSRLPPVRDLLNRIFPNKLVEHDIFTGIAAGLAIADYHDYEFDPDTCR